jgi:DHA2 family multidrug resistance protein
VQAKSFMQHRQDLYAGANQADPYMNGMIAGREHWLQSMGAEDPHRQALMHYANMLDREALVMAFNDQFVLLAAMLAIGSLFMWFMRRAPAPAPIADGTRGAASEAG